MCSAFQDPTNMSDDFEGWLGRQVTRSDTVTKRLADEFRATLAPFLFELPDENEVPPGLHWALAPAIPAATELGPDGAEAKGIFLPPIPLPRRMWAGGTIEAFVPIRIGMDVSRTSTISDLKMRDGKSGKLCFVSITHELRAGANLLLRERQDLLFREGGPRETRPQGQSEAVSAELEWKVDLPAPLLFRFSAVTFNGHRIHYDLPYAMEQEGYAGLVVHGPLQAALLMNQSAVLTARMPPRFDYRCTAPLIAGQTVSVVSSRDAQSVRGCIVDQNGTVTIESSTHARET